MKMRTWKETLQEIAHDFRNCKSIESVRGNIIVICFDLSFQMLCLYRLFHFFSQRKGLGFVALPLMYWQRILTGCHIHPSAELDHGVKFPHPTGIVIGQGVIVCQDVTIFQGVTLGGSMMDGQKMRYPVIEEGVTLYANAVVIGGIRVGRMAIVGAGSLVTRNVPPHVIVSGVPAQIVRTAVME
jgi:serine O-acetyltransferase